MKAKLRQIFTTVGRNARSFRGLAFLSCFVLFVASAALIVSLADKPDESAKDTTHKSLVTLSAGNFTISDPSKIQNNAGTLRLIDQGGGTYASDAPYVTSTNPVSYANLGGFTQQLGGNNVGQVTYRLSPDGVNWYWWNGSGWAPISLSNTIDDANTAAELNDHLDEFANQMGAGNVYVRAFFRSNGTQQVELQNVTINVYTDPAPTVTNVSPGVGPIAGGIGVTVTGTNFIPDLTPYDTTTNSWTSAGTTLNGANYRSLAVIGDKVYLFGGYSSTNVIYSAPLSNPANMTDTGKTLPGSQCCTQVAVIGNYVYMFGGYTTTAIWRAPVSDPTTWSTTGASMPSSGEGVGFYMVGSMLYYVVGNAIYSASASNPLVWTNTNKTISGAQLYPLITKIGSTLYFYSGSKIYTAPTSDPTTWTDTGKTLPGAISGSSSGSQLGIIGDKLYIYSGTSVYTASTSDPTTWTNTGISLSVNASNSSWALLGNRMYLYSTTSIYSAPVTGNKPNAYNLPWLTDRTSVGSALSTISFGGVPATNVQTQNSTTATATIPAHAAGAVDVSVTGYDGQTATLTNGFTYLPPPAVSGINPNSGSTAGGESVTLTGTGFVNGATVKFGVNAATNVTVVNNTTITVTTPAGTASSVDVTVTNPDGQKYIEPNGYAYLDPPPQASSVSPNGGPVAGGTNVTINGTGFIPPNKTDNTWSTVAGKTLPSTLQLSAMAVVGDKIYLYGGFETSNIYVANVSDPSTWTSTGKALPDAIYGAQIAVVGDKVYLYGGNGSGGKIYSASVSDPATVTATNKTLPSNSLMYGSQIAVIGSKMYLYGSYSAPDTQKIFSANTSDPTTWTDETAINGKTLPGAMGFATLNVIGDKVYLYGSSGNSAIYYADTSDPTTWHPTGKTFTSGGSFGQSAVIGDYIYYYAGTSTSHIYSAPVSDPTTWTDTGKTIPVAMGRSQMAIINNALWLFGGQGTNQIFSASLTQYRPNIGNRTWMINWANTPNPDQFRVTFDGVLATNAQITSSTQITATTPAHASGQVNVVVTNYDGQSSTITNGFEYLPPPSVSGVVPVSGSMAGGDTVTISGDGFVSGATVKFGGIDATGVTYINSHTITAITPANSAGARDVTVTNPDNQTATLSSGFTYLNPPPVVSDVDPESGPITGGTNVTITGSGFLPPNTINNATWATHPTKTLPDALYASQLAVVGSKIYLFGGYTSGRSAKIYSANVSDPTTWTYTNKNLPAGQYASQVVQIGSKLWLFGGHEGSNVIYSANVSDPTTWTDTGTTLPTAVGISASAIIGDRVYLFGGYDGSGATSAIYSAPLSDPTDWSFTGNIPAARYGMAVAVINDTVYLYGGQDGISGTTTIFSAQTDDLTDWTDVTADTGKVLPNPASQTKAVVIGDNIYIFGYYGVFSAPVSDPTTWTNTGSGLPGGADNAQFAIINDKIYAYGGYITNTIQSTSASQFRPNYYNPAWISNWPNAPPGAVDQSGVTFGGTAATNVTFVSGTQITATTPAHAAGNVNVAVTNYDGGTHALTNGFTYAPPPDITGISPDSGSIVGGDSITISGSDFVNGATVKFGNIDAADVTFVNSNTLTVITPPSSGGTKNVTVTNPDGQFDTEINGFTFIRPPPTITGINPNKGVMAGGTEVTITGTGFASNDVARVDSGAAATASSEYQTQTADKAFDADDGTYWDGMGGSGQWVQSMFDGSYNIEKIRWNKCGSDNAPYEVQIQLYQNGSWVTKQQLANAEVGVGTGTGDSSGELELDPAEASEGIRMYANNSGGWMLCHFLSAFADSPTYDVMFGGVPAADVEYASPTTLTAKTPIHNPGSVDVVVSDDNNQSDTLEDGFTFYPDAYAFTTAPLNVAATEPGALTVQARDENGDPVTSTEDITLHLGTDSGSGFFARDLDEDESTRWSYDSVVLPAGQSSVTFYYKDNFQGTPTITVTDPNNTEVQQQQTIGPRYKLLVTGVTDPVQSGVPSSITVQTVDYQGQPQTDYTGTIHFTSSDASALLPADFTFTPEMLGLHTFVNGVSMRSQGEWCVTATDTISASITGSQCDITVTPPNAGTISKLEIITQPQSFPADGHSSAITVQTQDVDGLPIPVASDTTIYVYSDSGTGQFSANGETGWTSGSPYEITIKSGTTSANAYYKDATTGTHTITMRDDEGTGTDFGWTNDSQPITVGVGDPAQLGVTAGSTAAAGEWVPVVVHLQDSVGNDVTSFKNVSVHMTSNSSTARFSTDPSGNNPVVTLDTLIPAGAATATFYVSDTTADQLILTATDSSPPGNDPYDPGNATITVGPGEPVAIDFLPVPDPVRAGEPKQLAAYLKDVYGNTAVATDLVEVNFTTTGADGSFGSSMAGPWTSSASVTINPGASTAPIYYHDTSLGNPVITASTSEYGDAQLNLQVIAGPYNGKLGFKTAPAQFTAGAAQTLQVELLDDYGNPTIADDTVPLVIDSSSLTGEFSLNGVSWSPTFSPDIPTGQGYTTLLYRDTKAGSVTIGAQENSKPATRVTYSPMIVAAAPAKYVYTSNQQIITKNTTSNPIVVELQDQYNNPADAPNGFSATITTTSVSGEFSLNGTSGWVSGSLSVPFATGASSAAVRYRDNTNGTYALTASGNGLTAANQNIRVVEGVPGRIVLSSSGNVVAGASIAVTLKTQTSGGIDTPVLEDTTFDLSGIGEFSRAESPWNPVTSVTLNEGEGEITLYYRSIQAGINTVTAQESPSQGWAEGSTDIVVGGAEAYRFGFTAKPTNVPVTEASGAFTVSMLDIYGNVTSPDSDTTAYLYTTAGTGAFSANTSGPWSTTSVTIPAGGNSATFHYRDTVFDTPTITVSDKSPLESPDEDILNATAPIDVIGQQASKLVFTTTPQTITAGGLSSVITIQLQKSDNTPAIQDGDRTFTFWPGGGGDQLVYLTEPDMGSDPVTEITIPRGQSSVNYYVTGTIAGEKLMDPYTYSFPGVGLMEAKQYITVNAATPESLVFTTTPQTVHAGEDSDQMKVELRDTFGNPTTATTDTTVNLASSCGAGQFSLGSGDAWSPITSAVIPAGQDGLYFYYRDSAPAICTLTISETDLTSAQQDIEVIYSAAIALDFTSAPQTIVAGQNSNTITVSTKDIYGNIAPVDTDTTVYFSTNSASGQFSQNSVVIPAGQSSASVTYRDTKPGSPTLQARDQAGATDTGLSDATQGITITAGTPTKFAYVPDTFNVVAGQLQSLKIELHNEYDVPYVAGTNKTINLSTTVADGEFRASNNAGAPTITQATIPAGESSVTVYYRQTTAAVASLTAVDPDTGLGTGTALGTVFSDALKGMRFVTSPQTLEGNQPSGAMTVAAVDEFGNTTAFTPTPMTLYLYSNSSSAKFYSDAGMTNEITSVTVNTPNTPAFTFYYRDSKLGASTITVSDRSSLDNPDIGIQNAAQTVTIVPGAPAKLGITGGLPELERGGADGPNYVTLGNAYDFEVNASGDQVAYLSSSSGTGEFATSASGPWQSTLMVVIPSGQSRAEFYYRDDTTLGAATITASDVSAPPEAPDAGLVNGTKNITVISGAFAQLTFTTAPQTITARHPSNITTVEALNRYGKPTTVTANTTIYLRSNAATGEFATSASGPWGISSMVMPANGSSVSFYYRDSKDGTPTLRASNSLSTNPSEVIATTQQQTIERQVLSHFLVTNISDPQYQGNPSSVVVAAVDSDNFVIDWYDGAVSFSASDGNAVLPNSYTFNPSKDKGIHTFVNGIAFRSAGEKTVTVTDGNGVTGQQTDITVLGNPAGAPAKLVFITPPSPLTVSKNQASEIITIQVQDSANMPTNAGPGGFPVRLISSVGTGEFATSASGPWQSAATFNVPEGLNYLNLYYRDSAVGQPQITARDWTGGVDNPAITNATLDVIVNALQITSSQTTSSQNFANTFVSNPLFFAYNEAGNVTGRASFAAEAREERDGTARPVNWSLTWKNGAGTTIGQQTADNTAQISYNPSDVTAQAGDGAFALDIQATDPNTDEVSGATRTVTVSPWQAKAIAPGSYTIGNPLPIQVESRQHQNLADVPQGVLEILNSSLQPTGSQVLLTNMQHAGTGTYDASLLSPALTAGQAYYALVRLVDPSGTILAEALSAPFQAQPGNTGGGGETPGGENGGGGTTNPSNPSEGGSDDGNTSTGGQSGTSDDGDDGGTTSPNQNKPSTNGDRNASTKNDIWLISPISEAFKKFFSSPTAPVIVSNSLFGFVIAMAIILLWQAYKELRQVRLLIAILEREKRTAEDKDNFLQLCAHYLRTPITIIAASSEMLAVKMGAVYAESTQTLATVVKNLQQKTEQLVTQTTSDQNLQTIVAPDVAVERRKLYRNPMFWMPIILSVVLTILGNWAASSIGDQSVHAAVFLQQLAVAIIAIILLYTGLRLRAMRRKRKEMLAEALHRRAELDQAKNQFVTNTYDLLAGDVYLLAEIQKKLPDEEKFVAMLGDGTKRLEKLMDKFKLLANIDTTQLRVSNFTVTQVVNQALDELANELKAKEITVDRHGRSIALQQDAVLLERVVSSVLANAAEFNSNGGTINVAAKQGKDTVTMTIRDNGPGFKQDPEQLFEAFKRGDDSLDFTHEGIGLDLYLDRLIMRHLGGDINARNLSRQGAEVSLLLPARAGG